MDLGALQAHIEALETELHHPGMPCTRERLEQLLHPDFHEVGRSGNPYDRPTVIRWLAAVTQPPAVVSGGFELTHLGAQCVLLTFHSRQIQSDPALPGLDTHRCSIWRQTTNGWQLQYHQGTPAAPGTVTPETAVDRREPMAKQKEA
jgi:hypothetical protein